MEPKEAIDIINRMFKGVPTEEQLAALDMAYDALEKAATCIAGNYRRKIFLPKM